MAFGMRRQFAAWMPARKNRRGSDDDDGDDLSPPPTPPAHPFKRVRLASMLLFRLVTFYVYAEGLSRSKLSEEYTHKYCLFLACLQAARVWSLLKSPESDSKISSIRIPALDLHMSLIVVMTHMLLRCVDVLFFFCVFVY